MRIYPMSLLNLILGKYGKLPGEIEPDLLRRAEINWS
jgi:hypothetical protein